MKKVNQPKPTNGEGLASNRKLDLISKYNKNKFWTYGNWNQVSGNENSSKPKITYSNHCHHRKNDFCNEKSTRNFQSFLGNKTKYQKQIVKLLEYKIRQFVNFVW